jgi:hypothetical protein
MDRLFGISVPKCRTADPEVEGIEFESDIFTFSQPDVPLFEAKIGRPTTI